MRLIVFFDLPVGTSKQRKAYRQFRKNLIKEGFLYLQESVYVKLAIDDRAASSTLARMSRYRPEEGLVQVLKVTEKQYATMTTVVGKAAFDGTVDSMDDLVII